MGNGAYYPPSDFELWMKMVDRECQKLYGISIHDLADYCFRDAYKDGESPKAVAKAAYRADQG